MDHMAFGRSEGLVSCLVRTVMEWLGRVGTTYLIFIYLICCGSTPQRLMIPKRHPGKSQLMATAVCKRSFRYN